MKKEMEKAIELYKTGMSMKKVVKMTGVSYPGLNYQIKIQKIPRNAKEPLHTKESIEEAINLYKKGYSINHVNKITKISKYTLTKELKKFKEISFKNKTNLKPPNPLLDESVELYKTGLSSLKVVEKTGITIGVLTNRLKKLNLTRNNSINSRKYHINHNFFEKIDTEEKAYWLGFIYADGYIHAHKYSTSSKYVGIALSVKDKNHLEKFSKTIESTYPIHQYINKSSYGEFEYCRLLMTSSKMFNDLQNKGVFIRKTLILKFPNDEIVPYELKHHFLRGYFDGDGSFKKNKKEYSFNVCGTKEFLNEYLKFINFSYPLGKRHKDNKNNFDFSISGRLKVIEVGNILYKNATVFLERKHERFLKVVNKFPYQNKEEYKEFRKNKNQIPKIIT